MWLPSSYLLFTACFRLDPALNTGIFLAFTSISSPVFGFLAILDFRSATRNTPNPINETFPPADNSLCMTSISPLMLFHSVSLSAHFLLTCDRLIVFCSYCCILLSHNPHNRFRCLQSISRSRYRSSFALCSTGIIVFSYPSGTFHVPTKNTFARLLRRSSCSRNIRY